MLAADKSYKVVSGGASGMRKFINSIVKTGIDDLLRKREILKGIDILPIMIIFVGCISILCG